MSEAQEQRAVIDYCDTIGIPIYHVPNEGKRSAAGGANLRAQGLRKGFPDLCVPMARGKYHALYIEMKAADGGRISDEQARWIQTLREYDNCAYVCHGADNAIALIDAYLDGTV